MTGTQGSTDPFYKSRAWFALRGRALARDNFQCVKCGACVRGKGMSRVDHKLPRKTHPHLALELDNVQTLCPACDNAKHREKGYTVRDVVPVGFDGAPAGWFDGIAEPERK